MLLSQADEAGLIDWDVSVDARIARALQHATNTTRPEQDTGGSSNYKPLPVEEIEPAGTGIGRSRGGLTTKVHHVVEGNGMRLAIVVTGGPARTG